MVQRTLMVQGAFSMQVAFPVGESWVVQRAFTVYCALPLQRGVLTTSMAVRTLNVWRAAVGNPL